MGLLGTVSGIVRTFQVISAFGTGNQALMSDSIAESLMATQNSLLVAFPLLLMHVYLSSRAEAIEQRALAAAHALINRNVPAGLPRARRDAYGGHAPQNADGFRGPDGAGPAPALGYPA